MAAHELDELEATVGGGVGDEASVLLLLLVENDAFGCF